MATRSGIKAGRAWVEIEALDKVTPALRAIEKRLISWGRRLQQLGQTLFATGMLSGIPVVGGINEYIKFDRVMRSVQARASASADEIARLRKQARGLGVDSGYGATAVGELMDILAQIGFNPKEIEQMTKPILDLGRAVGTGDTTDATLSAELVAGTLKAYRMEASQAADVADTFTVALNDSNFALEDMKVSMAYAGPIASEYGLSLQETIASLSVLRDLNMHPSMVATAFRNMMLELSSPKSRDDFNKKLKSMTGNVIDFVDESQNLRNVNDLLVAMAQATQGLGTAQVGDIFHELFGLRAQVPAQILGKSVKEATKMMVALQNRTGQASSVASTKQSGLVGAWDRFKATLSDVGITLGEAVAPALAKVLDKVVDLGKRFAQWGETNKGLLISLVAIPPVLILMGSSLIAMGLALKLTAVAVGVVAGASSLLFSLFSALLGITISITGVLASLSGAGWAGIVAAAYLLYKYFQAGEVSVSRLRGELSSLTSVVPSIRLMRESFAQMFTTLTNLGTNLVGIFRNSFNQIKNIATTTFGIITNALSLGDIDTAFQAATQGIKIIWLQLSKDLDAAWRVTVASFKSIWLTFNNLVLDNIQQWLSLIADAPADFDKWLGERGFVKAIAAKRNRFRDPADQPARAQGPGQGRLPNEPGGMPMPPLPGEGPAGNADIPFAERQGIAQQQIDAEKGILWAIQTRLAAAHAGLEAQKQEMALENEVRAQALQIERDRMAEEAAKRAGGAIQGDGMGGGLVKPPGWKDPFQGAMNDAAVNELQENNRKMATLVGSQGAQLTALNRIGQILDNKLDGFGGV